MKKRILIAALIAAAVTVGLNLALSGSTSVPTLAEGFGIWESEVIIDDASPGATGMVPLTIICGEDRARTFIVTLEQPGAAQVKVDYVPLLVQASGWITLPDEPIRIEAGEYHSLSIPFRVPYSSTVPAGTQMEARVRVTEIGHGGLVHLAIEAKWFIIVTAAEP